MEDDLFMLNSIVKSMKRLKFLLVWVAFGLPMILLCSLLILKPLEWSNYSPSMVLFQFIWCPIVPAAVFILIFTEAYGMEIKMNKYFHCITFVLYESIIVASICIFTYTIMHSPYIKTYLTRMQMMTPFEIRFYASFTVILSVVMSGIIVLSNLIKNTIVHISVCRSKMFQCKLVKTQYDFSRNLWIFDQMKIILCLLFQFIGVVLSLPLFYLDGKDFPYLEIVPFQLAVYTLGSQVCVSGQCFMGRYQSDELGLKRLLLGLSLASLVISSFFNELKLIYSGCIMFWICCLSIGRQWFLDMEINPQKYIDYFNRKADTLSV